MSFLQTQSLHKMSLMRPKGRLVIITVFFIALMASFSQLVAQNRYVSTSGVDAGDCSLPGSPCLTIQYAVNQAISGDNINVDPGTYNENVAINKPLQLLGNMAIVQGSDIQPGTFHIPSGIDNVTISGFTLIGFDSASPGLERAVIYLTGNHNNITISDNTIQANGEAGLLDEFAGVNNNLVINNNIFSGQTFVGMFPGDCGFANQFTAPNVPRQLVVIGNSDTNIFFTNNTISGTAGGIDPMAAAPCNTIGQGNTLVTIDATNATISGNTFEGTTARFATMLRARGTNTSIFDNDFDGSNLLGGAQFLFLDMDALAGSSTPDAASVLEGNEFNPDVIYTIDGSGNISFIVCTGPQLSATINGLNVVEDNNGINDTLTIDLCLAEGNITFDSLVDVSGSGALNVKVFQQIDLTNATIGFCNNCVAPISGFTGATGTLALVDQSTNGSLVIKLVAFEDSNDNNIIDTLECNGDTFVIVFNLIANFDNIVCPSDTAFCADLGTVDLAFLVPTASPAGGVFSGNSVVGTIYTLPTSNTTDVISYSYENAMECTSVCTFSITTYENPIAPSIIGSPDTSFVCEGTDLSILIDVAGDNGAGICVDEYRFSTDGGDTWSTWSPTIPTFEAVVGINIVQARRSCDIGDCDSNINTVTWTVNEPITSVIISAIPNGDVCLGATNVQYTANVVGGTGAINYVWCAYNSIDGSGTCFGSFTPGGNNPVQTRNWTSTTGSKSVGVTVNNQGCPDAAALYSFTVVADPVSPTLAAANPTSGTFVCEGTSVSATFNPGTSGTGTCIDTFRYSVDNGLTWLPYIPGDDIIAGNDTIIVEGSRLCDGLGCDGVGETFTELAFWPVNLNPTANIQPDPATSCAGVDLLLDGNPIVNQAGATITSHQWSGAASGLLSDTGIQMPTFNSSDAGVFELIYTVTDTNGCVGTDDIEITVFDNPTANITPDPAVVCPGTDLVLNGNPTGGSGVYIEHTWTGAGATSLDETDVVDPTFNNEAVGSYELIYTVQDNNGCLGADTISIEVGDDILPTLNCPASTVTMNNDLDRCTAVVCYDVSATDNCTFVLPVTLPGYTFIGSFNNNNYFVSNGNTSWEQANINATSVGGKLVSITSQPEQAFLNTVLPNGLASQYWIGLRYSPSLDAFKWVSGEAVSFTNWGVGQPGILDGDYVYHLEVSISAVEGWYDSPGFLNRRSLIEVSGLPTTLVAGLPSGANFPVGETEVNYTVSDLAGNTASCTFTVEVLDIQAPEITCPGDIILQLDPLECEGLVTFDDAVATDNCPGVVVTQTDGLASGELFEIGETIITFEAEDASGNLADCSFTVEVVEFQAPSLGCKPVNFSLDGDCEGELTPTIVLTGWEGPMGAILLGCLENYVINVEGPNGQDLGNTLTIHELNKTLDYSIENTVSGFTCWNTVTVEDKIAPSIVCSDTTINCLANANGLAIPQAIDNCFATAVLLNEVHEVIQCDEDFIGRIIRTWKAVDLAGNESEPCTQTILIERSNFNGIVFPINDTLSCSSGFLTDDRGFGYPAPSVTGVPTFEGRPLYPVNLLDMQFCNATIDYTDNLIYNTGCKTRIMRVWSITEWWCSTAIVYNMPPQFIDIIDNEAPIIPQVADVTLTTQSTSCNSTTNLATLAITDNCNSVYNVYINITNDGSPVDYIGANGGVVTLPVGVNVVTYTAIDNCGNTRNMSYSITVRDNTDPIAICDEFATVSIKTNGYTEVTANAIDDGSFDECGPVTLLVRRMEDPCNFGADTAWYSKVGFCCLDANTTRMVQLLVTDAGGNTNICMVSVNVQEKVNPSIACPNDITIDDCLFTFDPNNPDDYFGEAIITDNCPANNLIQQSLVDNRNSCGLGELVRTINVASGGITYGTCVQTITFNTNEPFDGNNPADLVWPKDYLAIGQCTFDGLIPESLPDSSAMPIFIEDACDLVGMRYDDQVFPFATNGACYKIIRTWTVIDWCQTNRDGSHPTWTYEQEIKVIDNEIPTITSATDTLVQLTFDDNCAEGNITLTASAIDCTPSSELVWSYIVEQDGDIVATGNSNNASGTYPVGIYTITFEVEDRCGNLASTSYLFEIRNAKAPQATCKDGLAASLVLMDTDNDGIGDTPQIMLTPDFFNNKSEHVCGYPLLLSFSSDTNDTLVVFDCDGIGEQEIQLWVTDINGNTSFCSTYVDVQDNNSLCPDGLLVDIYGKIVKEDNTPIQDVAVKLQNIESALYNTNNEGLFTFPSMPTGNSYSVTPSKDGDDTNGITTIDVIMIQRHILDIERLNSPYKLIAADVNNNEKVTSSDILELRKLILGLYNELPNNTSWRFVDKNFNFFDPTDPWTSTIQEQHQIAGLAANTSVEFIGIKIGDINGNATSHDLASSNTASRSKFIVDVNDAIVTKANKQLVTFEAGSDALLYGIDFTIAANDIRIVDVQSDLFNIDGFSYTLTEEGDLRIAVTNPYGVNVAKGTALITLEVIATSNGNVSEFIALSPKTKAEVYTNGLETQTPVINWRNESQSNFTLHNIIPNPFHNNTEIQFNMPTFGNVRLEIKDYMGRTFMNNTKFFEAGMNSIRLQRSDLGSAGVYIYELTNGSDKLTGKIILLD